VDNVMLVANPRAGSVSMRTKEVIVKALAADFKLEVHDTTARDHASELAQDAVRRGFDAVLAFGGDGTINEVAQPLVGTDVALGFLPGGTTNVLARSLGFPRDPVEATAVCAARMRSGQVRRVGVGRIEERYFLFSCGMGLDAEVVKRVEADPDRHVKTREWIFLRHAFAAGATAYRTTEALLQVEVQGQEPFPAVFAIICNARPFTYFKRFPVDVCPQARLDRKLDLLSLTKVRFGTIPRIVWSIFISRSHVRWRNSRYFHDIGGAILRTKDPLPVQVDGDFIGHRTTAEVSFVPDSLSLLV
jgi:diacylglycerol kinase family enzyme